MHVPPWKRWGCFVSERMWATVREDYSEFGDAWRFTTHDMARSKAFRWGEDGLAGWCDHYQTLVFSLALWNEKDPILKERLYGLEPNEGNHGEDVKEYYFYLDATPTYSYTKFLYKYPQNEFPYKWLVEENSRRTTADREFELTDTGIFNDNRYFDVVVEYAKADSQDLCVRIEIFNRASESARIHALPQLFFRNRWSWDPKFPQMPDISAGPKGKNFASLRADPKDLPPPDWVTFDYHIQPMYLYGPTPNELLFTNNESNNERLYNIPNRTPYVKDAFHRYLIQKEPCVNPEQRGTKACLHYGPLEIPAGKSTVLYFRLTPEQLSAPLDDVESIIHKRKQEADAFYKAIQPATLSAEEKMIQRQALAGMIWSVQYYHYDVKKWLDGDNPAAPPPENHAKVRNHHWHHLHSSDIISMPDKWEYPWFAAWDLCFHSLALSIVDLDFAKNQLYLLLKHHYQNPNGQIPAYEWSFSDTNPPVQAWALWELLQREKKMTGKVDHAYLGLCFEKLSINFSWWVNKVDSSGNNFFEGGFLGLDNISIIDRSRPMSDGSHFEQSDGTGWMGFFALHMMRLALELAKEQPFYEEVAMVYLEHFFKISVAIQGLKSRSIDFWDEEDGFFYDVLCYGDGRYQQLKVRSFVGLIPFCSLDFFDDAELQKFPQFYKHFQLFLSHHEKILGRCITILPGKRYLFSLMNPDQMERVLRRTWDPGEFFSPYGLRSLSKIHEQYPYEFEGMRVSYEPGESLERIKGGNSNWRGPVWLPTNLILICSLRRLRNAVGPNLGSLDLDQMLASLRANLMRIFLKDKDGNRPVHGDNQIFQERWNDLLLFYEHYHGETGRGLGASHQTGWSGLIANVIGDS